MTKGENSTSTEKKAFLGFECLTLRGFCAEESGQALLLVCVCLVVLIAFVGLAVDVGRLRYSKNTLQAAADAAELSASQEVTRRHGTHYFPSAKVGYASSRSVDYTNLVAYDIPFSLLTSGFTRVKVGGFASDYSLASGSPISGTGAVLVQ